MKTINETWKDFEAKVMPKSAGEVQRREMKRAFFSGFAFALDFLCYEVSELPEDDGVREIERKRQEIKGFNEAVKLGAA